MKTPQIIKTIILLFAPPTLYKKIVFDSISKMSWKDLQNEERELLLLKYLLKKDSIFFDIGANIGVYAYQAHTMIDEANIYAFEPLPKLYRRLKRSFKKVHIFQLAISNASENQVSFKIPIVRSRELRTRATLLTSYRETHETSSRIIQVKTQTLDDFVGEKSIHTIDLIKIDVEGFEFEVIQGAENSINKFAPILQIEIEQRHHHYPITENFAHLKARNYTCCFLNPRSNQMEILEQNPCDLQKAEDFKTPNYINNFYFFPNEKFNGQMLESINRDIRALMS
ncbi:MAG: FkbM family methyltransferase [Microscillaceae bacterium]|nr:FkbM family methyltransferase [Microscillaceae bacterium]